MWEAITGHAVDYKRVPRSEWLLLLGIASTKAQGILQGDLGRLVDQDKRSVPKRTDALVKKGYITKRTTLVRGTKTSKMWLKLFAPPLPKDRSIAAEPEAEMNLSRQVLAINLDAVPWHTRWTGESVDYTALATTIMAICKEWDVLRMQDLKSKLGVLGMRWQMKVVSKVCRFLNARDAIRYVAAKLNNKMFNDCVRFNRDLTPKDWSIFLATGKRAGKLAKTGELYSQDDGADSSFDRLASPKCLGVAPPWSADQPLAVTITKSIMACGDAGLTNPDVYGLTLGVSFTRFLSSLTTCVSTPNIQPVQLQHLQVKSEHSRAGKVASYRYSMSSPPPAISSVLASSEAMTAGIKQREHERWIDFCLLYGFSQASYATGSSKLANLNYTTLSQRRQRGRPRKIRSEHQGDLSGDENNLRNIATASHGLLQSRSRSRDSMIVRLRLPQAVLRNLMGSLPTSSAITQGAASPVSKLELPKKAEEIPTDEGGRFSGMTTPPPSGLYMSMEPTQYVGRGRGRWRGHGPSRPGNASQVESLSNDVAKRKRWKCDKCGRTWKNDIGLKYHLEKSQTSCNPSYSPSTVDGTHREMKSTFRSATIANSFDNVTKVPPLWTRSSSLVETLDATDEERRGERGIIEQHVDIETSQFKSPSRIKSSGGRYPHYPISTAPLITSSHAEEVYALDHYFSSHLTSEHRKPLNVSSIPQEHVALIPIDIGPSSRVLDLKIRKYNVNQLEDLPSTIIEPRTDQSRPFPTFASSFDATDFDKSQTRDERCNNTFGITIPAYDVGMNEKELTSNKQSHRSASVNLESGISKRRPPRSEVTDHISALLMEMLVQRHGVLAGGHSLWRALTVMWNTKYPEKPVPKTKDYQWALSRMLKDKSVLEHWHGFQDHSGLFSKCQILTLPHLDAFSAEVLAVVENIKLRHPQPFIPAQFQSLSSDVDPTERKENRRGRRILAGEVAQLDAPVYAAQVSAKRRHGMVSDTTNSSKRRRFEHTSTKSPDFASLATPVHEKHRVRWASNSLLPNKVNVSNPNNRSMAHLTQGAKIRFLTPNSFLEDDWSIDNGGVSQGTTRSSRLTDTNVAQREPASTAAVKYAMAEPVQFITGKDGDWPYLELQFFEEKANNSSFTICGWMPDADWFHWADIAHTLEKRLSASEVGRGYCTTDSETAHDRFMKSLKDCLNIELSQSEQFTSALPLVASPHYIFVNLSAGVGIATSLLDLKWQHDDQLTPESVDRILYNSGASISSDEDSEFGLDTSDLRCSGRLSGTDELSQSKIKRVALITRPLTSISPGSTYMTDELGETEIEDSQPISQIDLLAAFIVVRVLLGGADKAIDWGLLLHIFPNTRLATLRKFWAAACKEEGPHIKKFTRDVQERLIEAFESHELAMIDFEDPIQYDWQRLIRWAIRISRQEGHQIPRTRGLLVNRFSLKANASGEEDWGDRFFHAQSSIFSRFEAVTSEPGALPVEGIINRFNDSTNAHTTDIARSWIKSLCCTGEEKYAVRKIREKFLTLSGEGTERSSLLLKEAIDQLTIQRVICRSKKTPLGGRPYRLSEWYLSTLSRVAQRSKYEDAAAFKMQMDDKFRAGKAFDIPYTLNDGSMMALTNLNATGRIKLVPLDIPDIPFGFEPGNYESRKYPKSYYHFRLQAVPTHTYQYSEGIAVLQAVMQEDLPSTTSKGEIPQWIDFFGEMDIRRWSDILGAFCFTYATKGPMAVGDVCSSLRPILDEFEAKLIVEWGIRTGVFDEIMGGLAVTVGEWWWLAVPWQYNRSKMRVG
ncbi:tfiiic transcription initiation factor complex subunits tfc3 [Trichoderma arundinaceum]|uniref:Tfiiic transcription initiation factor complex subunits tfc3 n=1 Tax=Trichoderma arundinaceum TaxID=490622 RepID=A0A395NQS7_TRIAR|nr:tfiiic transcription initiation factor complex subunits tfc3 [Trichoderma arundinaceum]